MVSSDPGSGHGESAPNDAPGKGGGRANDNPRTVAELAAAKALPAKLLAECGVADLPGGGVSIDYLDADGNFLFHRKRGVPGDSQRFRQPAKTPLAVYGAWRLADRDGSARLYICEGESDSWTMWHHGLAALGLPGSGLAGALAASHLAGVTDLVVLPDNDAGGKAFAEGVAKRLEKIKYAGRAIVVHLPDGVKDVNDLHRLDTKGFRKALAGLECYATPIRLRAEPSGENANARTLKLTACETLTMRPTRWLVPDFIPRGGLTVIAGDGGEGKSAITLHLAAMVGRGEPCLGLNYDPPPPARVILAGCEDAAETTVLPRLAAAGADLSRVRLLDATLDEKGRESPFTLADADALDAALGSLPGVALVIIDPVSAFIPGRVDDHRDAEVRGLLRPLAELAARRDIAVVLVKHLNKSDSPNSGNLVAGSRAYVNASRAAFLVGADPAGEDGRCVLVFSKRNLTARSKGLSYSKVPLTLDEQDGVLASPQAAALTGDERQLLRHQLFRVAWHGETDVTDRDLAKARRNAADEKKVSAKGAKAAEWLVDFLKSGPRNSAEVYEAAAAAGFSRNATLEGKDIAGVVARKLDFAGGWAWRLPTPP